MHIVQCLLSIASLATRLAAASALGIRQAPALAQPFDATLVARGQRYASQPLGFNPWSTAWTPRESCPSAGYVLAGTFCASVIEPIQTAVPEAGYVRYCVLATEYIAARRWHAERAQLARLYGLGLTSMPPPSPPSSAQLQAPGHMQMVPPVITVQGRCPLNHFCTAWGAWFGRMLETPVNVLTLAEGEPAEVQCVPNELELAGDKRPRPHDSDEEIHDVANWPSSAADGHTGDGDQHKRMRFFDAHSPHYPHPH